MGVCRSRLERPVSTGSLSTTAVCTDQAKVGNVHGADVEVGVAWTAIGRVGRAVSPPLKLDGSVPFAIGVRGR
jgi:hypothetical protein